MPRLSILDLPLPPREFRPTNAGPTKTGAFFETREEARREDLTRAQLIRRACRAADVTFDREAALELADRLERSLVTKMEQLRTAAFRKRHGVLRRPTMGGYCRAVLNPGVDRISGFKLRGPWKWAAGRWRDPPLA